MSQEHIDRYIIEGKLGQGGMASVYRAHDPRFERDVAIKVLPREFMHEATFRARFDREARMVAQLEQSAIVPVHDFGEHEGQPYLVMRYMPGGSLADHIKERGALPLDEVTSILQRIASALDFAHGHGIIHRDVKPANILFDADGDPYLSDFGLVRLTEGGDQLTGSAMVGTPAYLAPEMADMNGNTPLVDVYALGVTLFQMLAGEIPFQADTPMGLIMAHISKPVPMLSDFRADLPEGIQLVVNRAMAKDPAHRYQSAGALFDDLVRAVSGELKVGDTHVMSVTQAEKARALRAEAAGSGGRGRGPIGWIIGGVALIAVLAAAVLLAGPKLGLTLGAAATPTTAAIGVPPTAAPTVTPLPPTPTPEPTTVTPVPPTPAVEPTAAPGWVPVYQDAGFQLSQTASGSTTETIPQTVEGAFRLSFTVSFQNPSGSDFTNGVSIDVRSGADPSSESYNAWRTFFLSRQATYQVSQLIDTTTYSLIEDHTPAPSFDADLLAENEVILTGQDETLTLTVNGTDVTSLSHPIDGLSHELFWRVYQGTTVDVRNVVLEEFK